MTTAMARRSPSLSSSPPSTHAASVHEVSSTPRDKPTSAPTRHARPARAASRTIKGGRMPTPSRPTSVTARHRCPKCRGVAKQRHRGRCNPTPNAPSRATGRHPADVSGKSRAAATMPSRTAIPRGPRRTSRSRSSSAPRNSNGGGSADPSPRGGRSGGPVASGNDVKGTLAHNGGHDSFGYFWLGFPTFLVGPLVVSGRRLADAVGFAGGVKKPNVADR